MLTINEVYTTKRENPNLNFFEIIQILQEKYTLNEKEVAVFVKSNKTLFNEVKAACLRNNKIKGPQQTDLTEVF